MNMKVQIRPLRSSDVDALVELSLLAWAPVFHSFEQVLGQRVFKLIWPDWMTGQAEAIKAVCQDENKVVLVAQVDGSVIGFVAYGLDVEPGVGEVFLLAVHPAYQNHGVGTALNKRALDRMKEAGMKMAKVETGGDPAHAPARASYQKAGYTALPLVRYFKALQVSRAG